MRGLQSAVHEAILLSDARGLQRALQARGLANCWLCMVHVLVAWLAA